jgi:filamentous hemagglutinin family protein
MICIKKGWFSGLMLSFLLTSGVFANPVLDRVNSGNVTVQQTPTTTTINQSSQQAIIHWQSFNINSGEATHFIQPAGGIALNRINPTEGASQIYGVLTATGQIILVNPAGIYFGPGAYVNVGGLIATTSNISDKNFLSGHYYFDKPSPFANPQIINAGTMIAAQHGLIALIGPNVTNSGMIRAELGKVVLASADVFTVDLSGSGMLNFAVKSGRAGSVTNTKTGSLIANGGEVLVSAEQASGVLDNVINLQGVVQARSVYKHGGEIIISGSNDAGVVNIAARINAAGKRKGQTGGTVAITGYDILLNPVTSIDVSGYAGGGNINVGGNEHGVGNLPNANAVVMASRATLNANAITAGNGGNIVLWSEEFTQAFGSITAKGGSDSGNGGLVETSSHNILDVNNLLVNTSALLGKTGTWLMDPADVTISTGTDTGYSNVTNVFEPNASAASATVNTTTLANDLLTNNITIATTNNGADGGSAGTITISSPISWASNHSLTLTADNAIAINAGITIGNSSAAQLILNAAGDVTQTAAITGPGQLIMNGAGTFTASQANTYTGGTTINAGVVLVQNSTGLGNAAATATVANGAILAFIGSNLNVANNINLNNGSMLVETVSNNQTQLSGSLLLNADNAVGGSVIINIANPFADTLYLSGTVSSGANGVSVTKTGPGMLELSGNNTFTGSITDNLGTIKADSSAALGGAALTLNAAGNAALTLNGTGLSLSNAITLDNGSTITNTGANTLSGIVSSAGASTIYVVNASDNLSFTNNISGSGSLSKTGLGTLSLSGNSSGYSGTMNINGGTVSIAGNANALGTGTVNVNANTTLNIAGSLGANLANTVNVANASLVASGTNTLSGSLAFSGANLINNSGTLTIGSSSLLSGSGSLTENSSGTWVIASGGANNTYGGSINLIAGTLSAGNATNPFGSGAVNLNGGTLIAAQTTTLANNMTIGGNVIIGGSNNITLSASNLSSGTLSISNSGTTNFNGALSGAGGISISAGTTKFSGSNGSYSGAIALSGGTLQINNNNANPLGTGSLALSGGSMTSLVTLSHSITNTFSVGGNVSITGSNNMNFSGNGTLASGNTLNVTNSGTTTLSGSLSGSGNITVNGGTLILSGNNTGFSAADSYAGTTNVTGASSVFGLTNGNALGYSAVNASSSAAFNINNVNVSNNGNVITLNNASLTTNGTAALNAPITLTTSSTDTINVNNSSTFTLNNNMNGQANLNVSGAGSMVMNGEIGNVTPLLSTNVTIAHITYGGTATITLYNQTSNSPIILTNDAQLISELGNITVNGTVNGNYPFTVQANNGTTYFNGVMGAGTPLAALQAFGQLVFGGGSVATSGAQIYHNNVTLAANTSLTTHNNSVEIDGNITGNHNNLSIVTGSGNIILPGQLNGIGILTLNTSGTTTLAPPAFVSISAAAINTAIFNDLFNVDLSPIIQQPESSNFLPVSSYGTEWMSDLINQDIENMELKAKQMFDHYQN